MGRLRAYVKTNKKKLLPEDPVIPSQVTDLMMIDYCPHRKRYKPGTDYFSDSEEFSSDDGELLTFTQYNLLMKKIRSHIDVKNVFVGKWMLFHDISTIDIARGMTEHDYAWQFILPIVDDFKNTRVHSASCSTSFLGYYPRIPNSTDGVICCFTKDYRDIRDVKKAGDSIRKMFNYPRDMHYKTDAASLSGVYKCYGHKYVCIYKHKPDCSMYVRDTIDPLLWRPVEIEN